MADRAELLNAMKIIKEHCNSKNVTACLDCEIVIECNSCFQNIIPGEWDLEDGDQNGR